MEKRRFVTPAELRQAHALAATGLSSAQIGKQMGVKDRTVRDWLSRPIPPPPKLSASNKVCIMLPPEEIAAMDKIAAEQGDLPRSRVLLHAWELYRDAMERLRTGSTEPLNIRGY